MSDQTPHHTIKWVEVSGGGFLRGVRLELVDGLNCIIGGRGTGKTTVVELLRYVLGLVPDDAASPGARALRKLVQKNLGGGRVRAGVRTKHGMVYLADRSWSERPNVRNQGGEATAISFDRELIFTADVYSQNEVEDIARCAPLQLALIDKFVDEEMRSVDADIRRLLRELDDGATELRRLDRSLLDLGDTAAEAPMLEAKLKELLAGSDADGSVLTQAHMERARRGAEQESLELLREDLHRTRSDVESTIRAGMERR